MVTNLFFKIIKVIIYTSTLLAFTNMNAQQTTNSAGGDASGEGGTSSYTVGQIVYTTASGIGGSSSQGVQQVYDIEVITGNEITNVSLDMNTYPNPTTDILTLTVANPTDLSYQLFDLQGNKVENNEIIQSETQINLERQPTAIYLLKILQDNTTLKTLVLSQSLCKRVKLYS